ncbi:MAG: hypothetical protein ACXADY_16650 [Candidatus Hodarchaeales archaeon]
MDLLSDLQPTLEILDKIVAFEEKMEYNRLLLFISLAGFVGIIGGWIEYVCYHFLSVDSTFLIFGLSPVVEPVLFYGLWLIYLIPLIGVIIFTAGLSPGFINWNKAYRIIGVIIIALFSLTHLLVLLVGYLDSFQSQLIPMVWGSTTGIGFFLTGRILFIETRRKEIQLGLFTFGVFAIFLGIVSSFIFYTISPDLAMFLFSNILGLMLICISMITYWKGGRTSVSLQEVKKQP